MTFLLIEGRFCLVDTDKDGKESGFSPDGDSMQFLPNDPGLLHKLTVLAAPLNQSAILSSQLRFEGIDAVELHYAPSGGGHESHQPLGLAQDSRGFLTSQMGMDPVEFMPNGIDVQPPAINDQQPGYILARSLEVHGRPVAFVFAGAPTGATDGDEVFLDATMLEQSLNYRSIAAGSSYPLFYDTLFSDLRAKLGSAVASARSQQLGLWKQDVTQTGLQATGQPDLEANGVILPKLFRRLTDYFGEGNVGLVNFLALPELHDEHVQDLDASVAPGAPTPTFDTFIDVTGDTVSLRQVPEKLVFVSKK